jgi:hypothetical protein
VPPIPINVRRLELPFADRSRQGLSLGSYVEWRGKRIAALAVEYGNLSEEEVERYREEGRNKRIAKGIRVRKSITAKGVQKMTAKNFKRVEENVRISTTCAWAIL